MLLVNVSAIVHPTLGMLERRSLAVLGQVANRLFAVHLFLGIAANAQSRPLALQANSVPAGQSSAKASRTQSNVQA